MALWAMSLHSILGGQGLPSQGVYLAGNRFQMSGVDARGIATKMIELQTIRDRADKQFVSQNMCRGATSQ
jgi:hypothetical protein